MVQCAVEAQLPCIPSVYITHPHIVITHESHLQAVGTNDLLPPFLVIRIHPVIPDELGPLFYGNDGSGLPVLVLLAILRVSPSFLCCPFQPVLFQSQSSIFTDMPHPCHQSVLCS